MKYVVKILHWRKSERKQSEKNIFQFQRRKFDNFWPTCFYQVWRVLVNLKKPFLASSLNMVSKTLVLATTHWTKTRVDPHLIQTGTLKIVALFAVMRKVCDVQKSSLCTSKHISTTGSLFWHYLTPLHLPHTSFFSKTAHKTNYSIYC
jgi:hypothetical protein